MRKMQISKDIVNPVKVELVSKDLNHLAAILHVYAGVWILWSKKNKKIVIIFQKENGNTFTLLIIFIVKSLQKEQNSTNLLLWPPICRNKPAITPKWFNSLDTNSMSRYSKLKAENSLEFVSLCLNLCLQLQWLLPVLPMHT